MNKVLNPPDVKTSLDSKGLRNFTNFDNIIEKIPKVYLKLNNL
jgi:hypothetical protein